MVEIAEEKLEEIENKIRDLINQIEIYVADEKISEDIAEELNESLREIANLVAS